MMPVLDDDILEWYRRDWRLIGEMHYLPEEDLVYYVAYCLHAFVAEAAAYRLRRQL